MMADSMFFSKLGSLLEDAGLRDESPIKKSGTALVKCACTIFSDSSGKNQLPITLVDSRPGLSISVCLPLSPKDWHMGWAGASLAVMRTQVASFGYIEKSTNSGTVVARYVFSEKASRLEPERLLTGLAAFVEDVDTACRVLADYGGKALAQPYAKAAISAGAGVLKKKEAKSTATKDGSPKDDSRKSAGRSKSEIDGLEKISPIGKKDFRFQLSGEDKARLNRLGKSEGETQNETGGVAPASGAATTDDDHGSRGALPHFGLSESDRQRLEKLGMKKKDDGE